MFPKEGSGTKPVRLSAINTRFSWKKLFASGKRSINASVTNLSKRGTPWIFYPFIPFSILNFAKKKWFCLVTCFAIVFKLFFSSLKQFSVIFIQSNLFYNVVHISSEMLLFLHHWDYCLKVSIWYRCQNKIETYYHHDGEQLGCFKKSTYQNA